MRLTQDDPQECLLAVDAAHRPPPWTLCLPRILTNRPSAQVSLWPWAAQGPRVAGGTLSVGDRRRALDHLPSYLQQRVAVGGLVLEPTGEAPAPDVFQDGAEAPHHRFPVHLQCACETSEHRGRPVISGGAEKSCLAKPAEDQFHLARHVQPRLRRALTGRLSPQ